VAYAKVNPGKLNYANNGVGGYAYLVGAALHHMMGIQVTDIQYKSGAHIATAMISGEADATITGIAGYLPHVKAGKLRLIGLAGIKRAPNLPDLPTLSEQGATGFDYSGWYGILAPAKTPNSVVMAINAEIVKATKDRELLETLSPVTIVTSSTPEEFRALIVRQIQTWHDLAKSAKLKLTE
jgi:tripartite-type tricarboxylate transporter receptor subunit TctC